EAVVTVQDAQVVVRVVKDLLDSGVGEQVPHGREVGERERIHDGRGRGARQLDQEDAVAVAVEARGLGIGGDERLPADRRNGVGQRLRRADVVNQPSLFLTQLLQTGRDL